MPTHPPPPPPRARGLLLLDVHHPLSPVRRPATARGVACAGFYCRGGAPDLLVVAPLPAAQHDGHPVRWDGRSDVRGGEAAPGAPPDCSGGGEGSFVIVITAVAADVPDLDLGARGQATGEQDQDGGAIVRARGGSHMTVVAWTRAARLEYDPKIAEQESGQAPLMVSQFMVELVGTKVMDGEAPPRILHFNAKIHDNYSGKAVIEMNSCYRMQWGQSQWCEGYTSRPTEETGTWWALPTSLKDVTTNWIPIGWKWRVQNQRPDLWFCIYMSFFNKCKALEHGFCA